MAECPCDRGTGSAERLCSWMELNNHNRNHCSASPNMTPSGTPGIADQLYGSVTPALLPWSAAGSWTGRRCPGRCWGWQICIPPGLWCSACSPAASECRTPGTVEGMTSEPQKQPGEMTDGGCLAPTRVKRMAPKTAYVACNQGTCDEHASAFRKDSSMLSEQR